MQDALYVAPNLAEVAIVRADLAATTERHKVALSVGATTPCTDPLSELNRHGDLLGVILDMERGWPGSSHLRFAGRLLKGGRRVWLYWPGESAIECLDRERLASYWRHWGVVAAFRARNVIRRRILGAERTLDPAPAAAARCLEALDSFVSQAAPVPLVLSAAPDAHAPLDGVGVYLRTDFWVRISSGGSYGHTCYVARELAARSRRFVCFMAQRYAMLDDFGLQQVVMPAPSTSSTETDLMNATWYYHPLLKVALDTVRPSYIYERVCLGNFAGALLSRELGIPYIVEYNGSEISMSRSFDGAGFRYADVFERIEDAAFRQATMINVVSDAVAESLVARGVDRAKVLVNPNGADPATYKPPTPEQRTAVRSECGFTDADRVVGFTGTFGGWHGIDVLAAAIPKICADANEARFLLIGDGSQKPIVDDAVARHGLGDRVKSVGRVPQHEGARLLAACDIYVSPHNSHMVDSRFFGSPTKLFEYMAMGGGVVGSDLEQLGEVLSPALRSPDLERPDFQVTDQRAVLCTPGEVGEFTSAVVGLVRRPDISAALGRNARRATLEQYSWQCHVERIWRFLATGEGPRAAPPRSAAEQPARIATGDQYKDEVQHQWNENPVGTQYAKQTRPHSLEWYREIEAHRYGQYAPWMPQVMEFAEHAGHELLEIGAGVGTDLSQFARHGARVTDLDLSAGHLAHAKENFALRKLAARFVHHDAETLPFDDGAFDVVYSNGVLHHTPNTRQVVEEVYRVLKPGGKAIIMMYAEDSLHYWYRLVWELGLERGMLDQYSMGEIMSRHVEITKNDARPLVKVYTRSRLRRLFRGFADIHIVKRQLTAPELPRRLRWMGVDLAGKLMGWNLVVKARKPTA